MMVIVNYEEKLRAAYRAGAVAASIHAKGFGPKPDVDRYLEGLKKIPAVVRG